MNAASPAELRQLRAATTEVYASFLLGAEEFALSVQHVQEVVNTPAAIVPLPLAPDFVCGCFDLRGAIVPVIDMARLLERPATDDQGGRKTVVVEHHGVRLGLLFDDTCRVLRSTPDSHARFDYAEGTRHGVISGVLRSGDALVRLLDLERLSGLGDIPHTTVDAAREQAVRAGRARRRCVSFRVGAARLAFPIHSIFEIVPARRMEPSPLQDRLCAGVMRIRSRIVPIIRFGLLLQAGAPTDEAIEHQRVIVLERGTAFVGLLVDEVEAIDTYAQDALMPVPMLARHNAPLFAGCLDFGPRGHVFLLDGPGVLALDEVGRVLGQQSALFQAGGNTLDQVRRAGLRQPFLWIESYQHFALPMKAVREIVDAHGRLVPMPGAPDWVPGMLNLRGRMVPVVDMRGFYRLGGEPDLGADCKIVVLDQGELMVGLRVDRVRSILHVEAASRIAVPQMMRMVLSAAVRDDVQQVIQAEDAQGRPIHLLLLDCARLFTALDRTSDSPAAEVIDA